MDIIKKGMNGQDSGLIPTQEDLWVILEEEIPDLVMEEAEVEAVVEEEEEEEDPQMTLTQETLLTTLTWDRTQTSRNHLCL